MKRGKKAIALLLAVLVCGNLFACGGKSRELGVPARAEALSHEERLEAEYRKTAERAEAFASRVCRGGLPHQGSGRRQRGGGARLRLYGDVPRGGLRGRGETREEILSALGLSVRGNCAPAFLLFTVR